MHGNEATKASRKRKQSVYEGFRSSFSFVRRQYLQLRSITVYYTVLGDAYALLRSRMHQERLSGGRRVKSFVLSIFQR